MTSTVKLLLLVGAACLIAAFGWGIGSWLSTKTHDPHGRSIGDNTTDKLERFRDEDRHVTCYGYATVISCVADAPSCPSSKAAP